MSLAPHEPFQPAQPAPTKPRVVALLNQKGGVGKTTSTVNLGAALARYGQRVLLIDLDPQSNLSLHFGVEPRDDQPSVHDLLVNENVRVEDVVVNARPRLDFVPAVTELALVEGELAQRPDMQHVLRRKLESVWGRYDVVLLDCPPSLGVLSVNALTVADEVFVPMQAHYLPLRGLEKLLQTVHMVSQGLNPGIRVTGVLLCMHEGLSSHARAVIGEIESQLAQFRGSDLPWSQARVLAPPVRRNIKLAEAPSFGQTIFDYAPRCPGAEDYRRLAESLLRGWGIEPTAFEQQRPRRVRRERAEGSQRDARTVRRRGAAKPSKKSKARTASKESKSLNASKASKPSKPSKSVKPSNPSKRAKFATTATRTGPARASSMQRGNAAKSIKAVKPKKASKAGARGATRPSRTRATIVEAKPLTRRSGTSRGASQGTSRGASSGTSRGSGRATLRRASRAIRSGGLSL